MSHGCRRPSHPAEGESCCGRAPADGIACYHTGRDGAVTVELLPEGVRVETFGGR